MTIVGYKDLETLISNALDLIGGEIKSKRRAVNVVLNKKETEKFKEDIGEIAYLLVPNYTGEVPKTEDSPWEFIGPQGIQFFIYRGEVKNVN